MPDPNYVPSEQAQNDFLTWVSEYYGYNWSWLQMPSVLMKFRDKNNAWYKYWAQNVWTPAHPAETPPEPVSAEVTEPVTFAESLPDKLEIGGKSQPVNYTPIGTTEAAVVAIDPITGAEEVVRKPVTLYAPVPSLENLNDENLKQVYKNIYGVFNDGSLYEGGRTLNPDELQSYAGYDPVKKTLSAEGLAVLREDLSYASMLEWAQKNYGATATNPRVDELLKQRAAEWAKGNASSPELLKPEIEKYTYKAGEEIVREKIPVSEEGLRQRADARQGMITGFEGTGFNTETDLLQAQMAYYKPLYDQYGSMLGTEQAQTGDTEMQQGLIGAQVYANAQARLSEIKGGAPQQIGEFQPSTSKMLTETAGELGIPAGKVANISRRFVEDQTMPEFKNLTIEERKTLTTAGLEVAGQQSTPEEESKKRLRLQTEEGKRWENLVNQARLRTARPERLVRL